MDNTIENNRLIAEFMGRNSTLDYHTEWNHLMPVVDKINKIEGEEFGVTITGNKTTIESCYGTYDLIIEIEKFDFLQNTYVAVTKFIKWHSSNQPPTINH